MTSIISERGLAIFEVLGELRGWCSVAQVRQGLVARGFDLTPDQVAHALYSLHESGRVDRPQMVERREAEPHERTRGGRWLFRRRHVAEGA